MAVRKDHNGQTIIVSEGVDVDGIDFDQMIENPKTDIQKITETIQNTLLNAEKKQSNVQDIETKQSNKIANKQEPIWIQILFLDENQNEIPYSGILLFSNAGKDNVRKFSIKMDRPQAIEFLVFCDSNNIEKMLIKSITLSYEEKEWMLYKNNNREKFSIGKVKIRDSLSEHFINVKIDLILHS